MVRKFRPHPDQLSLFDPNTYLKTAPCVPLLRERVYDWRQAGYPGVTAISYTLLQWWFHTDHRLPNGRVFSYYSAQQDAIETLIYVYEVARARSRYDLLRQFASLESQAPSSSEDDFSRYCTKMATGTGKTKVMSLAVVWQYLNSVQGGNDEEFARTFLIIAPNVIVFERLKADFSGGRIFQADPVMPEHLRYIGWDVECIMRGESKFAHSDGLLLLTNIQQFYERPERGKVDEPAPLAAVLGPQPSVKQSANEKTNFIDHIRQRSGKLLIINDEAHHTHYEESKWSEVIKNLHTVMPVVSQLDFSATPRFRHGTLFPWTISDYPLKQAIVDGVVKRPYKGIANIREVQSIYASERYKGFITAAVHRWREYRNQLKEVNKNPLLFVMLNSTGEADDVGDYLRTTYPDEFGGDRTLIIHTKNNGEIKESHVEKARQVVNRVDNINCEVNAIVSVLMLREGWDVQNVTVVVGLRPYNSKANILPEQTVGRGLRLMFHGNDKEYKERVDIIGNKAFLQFIENLERLEDIELENFDVGRDKLHVFTIYPIQEKSLLDISIPHLSPTLLRKRLIAEDIATIDVLRFQCPPFPKKPGDAAEQIFRYEGYDFITLEKEVIREYTIPIPKSAGEIIGYHAREVAKDLHLPTQFAALVPKIREFFEYKAFGEPTFLEDSLIIKAMSRPPVIHIVKKLFRAALSSYLVEEVEPSLLTETWRLSHMRPFPFSNIHILEGQKCILNYAPCTNEFERAFGIFLDQARDVFSWCKLPSSLGFAIEYLDQTTNLHFYYPDFIVKTSDETCWIVETKGAETVEVMHKDHAAKLWCENATTLTGAVWQYKKVLQKDFEAMQPTEFSDLAFLF